jgi:hypothetical protein
MRQVPADGKLPPDEAYKTYRRGIFSHPLGGFLIE